MRILPPQDYQPQANQIFHALAAQISAALPTATIEHIGSSAVPGLLSKGDLDVYVAVEPVDFAYATAALEGLGFQIKEDSLRTESLCPFVVEGHPLDVGVQLVARGSRFEFFLTLRDLLIADASVREAYNQLKQGSGDLDPHRYRAVKSAFIERVLRDRAAVIKG